MDGESDQEQQLEQQHSTGLADWRAANIQRVRDAMNLGFHSCTCVVPTAQDGDDEEAILQAAEIRYERFGLVFEVEW